MANELRCSHCDRLCREGEKYCSFCQEPIVNVAVSDGEMDGIPLEYWESFIDNNVDKYLKTFEKYPDKKWFRSFHFPACFFPFDWMVYRKMYWQAVVGWVINALLVMGMAYLYPTMPAFVVFCCPLVLFGLRVVFGMYAYTLYKQHCLHHLRRSLGSIVNGGVTILGVVVFAVIHNLLSGFLLEPLFTAIIYNRL